MRREWSQTYGRSRSGHSLKTQALNLIPQGPLSESGWGPSRDLGAGCHGFKDCLSNALLQQMKQLKPAEMSHAIGSLKQNYAEGSKVSSPTTL